MTGPRCSTSARHRLPPAFTSSFETVSDPLRVQSNVDHPLLTAIAVVFIGVLCGAEEWDEWGSLDFVELCYGRADVVTLDLDGGPVAERRVESSAIAEGLDVFEHRGAPRPPRAARDLLP